MKLTSYMNHLNTFHLSKTEVTNQKVVVVVYQKNPTNVKNLTKS